MPPALQLGWRLAPQAFTRRLERIGQLLGEDWQGPERVLDIQLALRLYQVRSALFSRSASAPLPPRQAPASRAALGSLHE